MWTYLTGSPQRENIVGCRTHSGPAALPLCQTGVEHTELLPQQIENTSESGMNLLFSRGKKLTVDVNDCLFGCSLEKNDLLQLAPPISHPRLQLYAHR